MRRSIAAAGLLGLLVLLWGCGGDSPKTYDAGRSLPSLQRVGWTVSRAPGPPQTEAGVRQVDYLETTAPDRRRIDLQFLETPAAATAELAARRERNPAVPATTIGNVVVIAAGEGVGPLPPADLAALRDRLRT